MLDEVHIRELGVIEDAELRLGPGLTVLTGETGAGKTMVVTALQQLAGERADAALVRSGAEEALIEARMIPPPPGSDGWIDGDTDELVVSRELAASGGSRARIGGRLAPISALAETVGGVVEIHAQQSHLRLADTAVQRELLDRYAGAAHARVLGEYRDTHQQWRDVEERIEEIRADARARARELDRLRFEVEEIEAAGLDPELDGSLDARLSRLENAEELRRALAEAASALGSDGAGDGLGMAVSALRRVDVDDPELTSLHEDAVGLAAEATDLAARARNLAEEVEADPDRLEELRARRRTVRGLTRKYGDSIAEVLDYLEEASSRITELESAGEALDELENRRDGLRTRVDELAEEVRRGRGLAAERLAASVVEHLRDLAMPHATMEVRVAPTEEPGRHGADDITFLLAANPGEPAVPLSSGASGGERSRVALAIEVALADVHEATVIVFDEIDAGVGGATALAVGEKLAQLASHGGEGRPRQVLCVTHLAQLAAFADAHHVVEKGVAGGRTVTTTRPVPEEDRATELARLLGGDVAPDVGRAHAEELIEEAASRRAG